jgi:predicted metal-binding membrane protein
LVQNTSVRNLLWITFFSVILLAWWYMFAMARMSGLDWIGRPVGMSMMMGSGFTTLFPMWAVMMAAMMLPTMVPSLRSYEDLMASANGTRGGWIGVLLGYFLVWVCFAALIALVQLGLLASGLIDTLGVATSTLFAGILLIVVGGFQFSRTKEVCHGVCHSPAMYFVGHWRTGTVGGVRMGMGLGAYCVGCCWGFMALGFVGGVMSLLWMGLATVFMVIEKLPQIGHYVTKPMGFVLILAGIAVIAYPYTMGV